MSVERVPLNVHHRLGAMRLTTTIGKGWCLREVVD
jgi:hypothetical protein